MAIIDSTGVPGRRAVQATNGKSRIALAGDADSPVAGAEDRLSWYVDAVFDLLAARGVGLCLHDRRGAEVSGPVLGDVLYVRFHGRDGDYHGSYSARALDHWARRLAEAWANDRHVDAFFNNDPDATATRNARALRARIDARRR